MSKPLVHLVNPLIDPAGGSEWRTIEMSRLLQDTCDVRIWTFGKASAQLAREVAFEVVDEAQGHFPRGGCIVIVGPYFRVGDWILQSQAERAVLIYNIAQPRELVSLRALLQSSAPRVDMVYASQWLMRDAGIAGVVQASPIDLSRFRPAPRDEARSGRFLVGRMSRDSPTKHHPPDAALYRALVAHGCDVRIMGGTVLRDSLGGEPGVELLPDAAIPPEQFLRALDCFYYRTNNVFFETFGRVVLEAMACAVPVVVHRRGGYAEWITDGETGFLVDNRREALARIMALKQDPQMAARVGRAARAATERTYNDEEMNKIVAFYRLG